MTRSWCKSTCCIGGSILARQAATSIRAEDWKSSPQAHALRAIDDQRNALPPQRRRDAFEADRRRDRVVTEPRAGLLQSSSRPVALLYPPIEAQAEGPRRCFPPRDATRGPTSRTGDRRGPDPISKRQKLSRDRSRSGQTFIVGRFDAATIDPGGLSPAWPISVVAGAAARTFKSPTAASTSKVAARIRVERSSMFIDTSNR